MADRQGQPRGLIWERLQDLPREPVPALSRERIVHAAIRIADAEGMQAISMRRIAADLGSGAMSLYRHVFSKQDLLDLMLDQAFGEIELPERPSGEWRADLQRVACETRAVLRRHTWLAALLSTRPPLGPNYIRYFEFALASVACLGPSMLEATRVFGLVYVYTLGFVSYEVAEEQNVRQVGLTETEKHVLAAPYVEQLVASGQYPHFARFFEEVTGARQAEDGFEWGLGCLLDGLAARLAVKAG
jgi:AcrR family transcriptional regulator